MRQANPTCLMSSLSAILDGRIAASVRGVDELIEGGIDKGRDTPLGLASVVVTTAWASRVSVRLRRDCLKRVKLKQVL